MTSSKTLEEWRYLAHDTVRGLTDEEADAVARLCIETEEETGISCGTWHAASVVKNWPRCPCTPCVMARGGQL